MNAPSNLIAIAVSETQINLSWKDNSTREVGFGVFQSTDNVTFNKIATLGRDVISYHATGLTASTKYYFKVRAFRTGAVSPFSNTATATTLGTITPPPPPPPTDGIAARYPGDVNIGSDPAVILADNFEAYTVPDDILGSAWGNNTGSGGPFHRQYMSIDTSPGGHFAGTKGLKFTLPPNTTEIATGLIKKLGTAGNDVLYVRMYQKWDANYHTIGSVHNGPLLSGGDTTLAFGHPAPADGTGFFIVQHDNDNTGLAGETDPGYDHAYVYWPRQATQYGDWWYPDGHNSQFTRNPSLYPDFKPMPLHQPQRGVWYCYELMVKCNAIGKTDGEVAWWVDGKLIARFPDLFLRGISSLKVDQIKITLDATGHQVTPTIKWVDQVVIARSYIGPMA